MPPKVGALNARFSQPNKDRIGKQIDRQSNLNGERDIAGLQDSFAAPQPTVAALKQSTNVIARGVYERSVAQETL